MIETAPTARLEKLVRAVVPNLESIDNRIANLEAGDETEREYGAKLGALAEATADAQAELRRRMHVAS
jgi:hypothetical protein